MSEPPRGESDDETAGFGAEARYSSDLVGDLVRWLADARVDAAAASRARGRWLRQQLEEEATLAGVLLDLAERAATVVVATAGGRRHRGYVAAVANDFCVMRNAHSTDVLLALGAITTLQPLDDPSVIAGGRPAALDMELVDALAALLVDRPRLLLVAFDGTGVSGELRSVGRDLVVMRPDGERRSTYLPVGNVAEVTITP